MARWKLTEPHYLAVPDVKWEYQEIDRITGRPKRTQFPVPLHIDPLNLDDLKAYGQMDPELGMGADPVIIVTDNPNPTGKDIHFKGNPTPGMYPLDDEARAISEKHSKGTWTPTAGIDPESQNSSYANKMMSGLIDQMTELKTATAAAAPVQGIQELLAAMTGMMQQNQQILAELVKGRTELGEKERRRVA